MPLGRRRLRLLLAESIDHGDCSLGTANRRYQAITLKDGKGLPKWGAWASQRGKGLPKWGHEHPKEGSETKVEHLLAVPAGDRYINLWQSPHILDV